MIPKRLLVPERLRRPPATGWSWIDRRFLHEHAERLSRDAVLLYLFLSAAADKSGLSFDVDNTLATALIDRLMHHGEGLVIKGDSYRMKDKPSDPPSA